MQLSELSNQQQVLINLGMNIAKYLTIAGGSYLLFWKVFKKKYINRFHNYFQVKRKDLKREITYSIYSMMIFSLTTIIGVYLIDLNVLKLYFEFSEFSITWYVFSWILLFLMHDAYFFWTHYALHKVKWLRKYHVIHHQTITPTPFAAFSFHPVEATIQGIFFLVALSLFPFHVSVLIGFNLYSFIYNVYGHMGLDMFGKKFYAAPVINKFTHSHHHSWHHKYQNGNYGFYLKFWDRVMGTWKGPLLKKE
ncbi:sterol desaturase family protein [Bacteriovoracaceae bacterium]|nr:sterol desaturase family protein [Bacteriovoracaceae bacterium]